MIRMSACMFFAVSVLSGCMAGADGGYRIEGVVVDEEGNSIKGCLVEERIAEDGFLVSSHRVESKFSELFTSAPAGVFNYEFIFKCDKYLATKVGPVRIDMAQARPVQLGEILVRKRALK